MRHLIRFRPLINFQSKSYSSFVTTPIFYVNAEPHIGHLYSAVIADAVHRHELLKFGAHSESGPFLLTTGTDEHGMKIEKAAAAAKSTNTLQHCDNVSKLFRQLADRFSISYSDFIRTTESRHKRAVGHFWETLQSNGHIYKSEYSGWYSIPDEAFVPETSTTEILGSNGIKIRTSNESSHLVEWTKEENYLFKLTNLIPQVREWIVKSSPIKPPKFGDILLHWIDEGFEDLSVSRPASRLTWGIPVPNDDSQVIYVWLDALVNYLSVAGYPDQLKAWPPTLQVVGKDILKFHGIYWPAFLMAAGLEPPKSILCHSHWTVEGRKMSKSLGNVVNPFSLGDIYGNNGLRYFLLREGTPPSDANFTEEKMRRLLNAELADTFGNLLSRCSGKAVNPEQLWPDWNPDVFPSVISQHGKTLMELVEALPEKVDSAYSECNFYRGLEHIMTTLRASNLYVEETKPWLLAKQSKTDPVLLAMLCIVFETLRIVSIMTIPVIPNLSSCILDRLKISPEDRNWSSLNKLIWKNGEKSQNKTLAPAESVFYKRVILKS